ncbi:MAG: anti-anti-sigma factor [Gloeobacteraceae cyanobacterium ES-bin-316]|nr:anti-anti-sigma factor [Ferruginibacter sp.]
MNVKIDTKEKFSVITLFETELAGNMTEELQKLLESFLKKEPPHLVLKMTEVETLSPEVAMLIASQQQSFYENNHSFVVCGLREPVENFLDKMELLEYMNVTLTESEAWDIVQMEEIERELMGDFDAE